jgi:hypothetical protein
MLKWVKSAILSAVDDQVWGVVCDGTFLGSPAEVKYMFD